MKITKAKIADKITIEYEIGEDKYRVISTDLPRHALQKSRAELGDVFAGEIPGMAAQIDEVKIGYDGDEIDTVKIKACVDTIYGAAELILPEIVVEKGTPFKIIVAEFVAECENYCKGKRAQLGFDDLP